MKSKFAGLILLVAALVPVARAAADPVRFTVTATADSTSYGYTSGQSYTFVFTTETSFTENGDSGFPDSTNSWVELQGDSQIWSTLGGTGLTGSFTDPAIEPSSSLGNDKDGGYLNLSVGSVDYLQSIGVSTLNSTAVGAIEAVLYFPEVVTFSYPGTYTDPTAYFANYVGDYSLTGGTVYFHSSAGDLLTFTSSTLTISVVPEPATYAAVLGLVAFGFCVWRRRRF